MAKKEKVKQSDLIDPEADASLTDQSEIGEAVEMLTFRKKGKDDVEIEANREGTIAILKGGGYKQVKKK